MDFTQPWDYGDITFVLEDRKIYANKATLAMSSQVFGVMFSSDFKEQKLTEIPLPDKKFDDFLQLMQILHPPHAKRVDGTNVDFILPLSHEYQIHHVFEKCVKTLIKQNPTIKNLNTAEKYNLPQLHEKCLQYVKDTLLSDLKTEDGFKNMKVETLLEVLEHKVEKAEAKETEIRNIASLKREWCDQAFGRHYKGALSYCSKCQVYGVKGTCERCKGCNGTSKDCPVCNKYNLDEIYKILKNN